MRLPGSLISSMWQLNQCVLGLSLPVQHLPQTLRRLLWPPRAPFYPESPHLHPVLRPASLLPCLHKGRANNNCSKAVRVSSAALEFNSYATMYKAEHDMQQPTQNSSYLFCTPVTACHTGKQIPTCLLSLIAGGFFCLRSAVPIWALGRLTVQHEVLIVVPMFLHALLQVQRCISALLSEVMAFAPVCVHADAPSLAVRS